MIAEWLATGKDRGNLVHQSRGYLDFGRIWAVAITTVLLSVRLCAVLLVVERRVLAHLDMTPAEWQNFP